MTSINFKKIICLLLVVIITASFMVPLSVAAEEQEKTHSELLKDVIAGLLTVEEAFGTLDAATVPEIVGYDSAVERTHIQRLYEEEGDDVNKIVFLNADGSHTAYIYDHPVKYVDGAGKIQDITLDIAESNVTGQFETAANSSITTFSRNVTDGIGLRGNNTTISLVPHLPVANAKTMSATKSTDNAVAKQIDSKRIAYTYDDKTTLEYSLTYTGFKEDIVVSEYTGQTEYDFTLYTNGLKLVEINKSFYLVDASGVTKAQLGDIIIFTADDKNNTMGDMVAQTVVENQEYLLTIVVDPEFLADKTTAYPIRIDPTVEICYDNNGNGAIEDVTINSGGGSDGTAYSLSIGLRQSYGIARILMKFPGLNFGSLGTNAIITNASVEIRDLMCESTPLDVYCYVFSGNEWTESTANWSNVSPNSISTFLSSKTISYESGTQQPNWQAYAFDITAAVEGWRTGTCDPDKGIILKASSSVENGSTYNYKTLASYNRSAYKPTLSVTYTNGAYLLDEGTYYLNNLYYGDYLRYSSSSVTATSGLISSLGNSIRWELRNVYGGYVIQSKTDPTKYLAVPDTQSSSSVQVMTVNNSVVPERCIWRMTLSSQGGCVLRSLYNSRYLYWNGSGLYTSTDLGDTNSTLHSTRVWRTLSTSYYGNTSSNTYREFSIYSCFFSREVPIGESDYFLLAQHYDNEIWCNEQNDFTYSLSQTGKIIVEAGAFNTIERGIVTVTATHKVTNRTTSFEVYVSNAMLTEAEADTLQSLFVSEFGEGYANAPIYNTTDVNETISQIIMHDEFITDYCNTYRIPKEFVQSVLFREIWCYSVTDSIADDLVQAYYAWKNGNGSRPITERTDSSTGLGQIFASTAISALNNADERGFINLETAYNPDDWEDVWSVWSSLHSNNEYNIQCCALVILDCQYEFEATTPYDEFFDYSEAQIKTILARYNGTGDAAVEYGNICYEYFELFADINA